ASSGMKSASIIELIATYFATDKEYMQNKYTDFVIDIFSRFKTRDTSIFLENLNNVKFNKERFSLFIEEPELSLFPNAQKRLIEYLVDLCFYLNPKKTIQVAFSTHSPYILSTLNCLLLAHQVGNKTRVVESIIPSRFWLDIKRFDAFKIKNGEVKSIIDKETKLILADEIDEVSEEIGEMFDSLLDLEYK
ncbi:AAA family ATPase, partial [Helicobacter typhlonius]